MQIPMILALWLLLALVGCYESNSTPAPLDQGLIPIEQFMGNPHGATGHKLSPGQTQFAFLQSSQGTNSNVMNLFVQNGTAPPVQITSGIDRNITQFRWFNEHRLGFLRDPDGEEGFRLYGVNADGSNLLELTPTHLKGEDTEPLWPDPTGNNRWVVAVGPPRGVKDLYWVDVETGQFWLKERNPGNIHQVVRSPEGQVLLAWSTDGVESTMLYRPNESMPFRPLATATFPDVVWPYRIEDGSHAIALSNLGRDKTMKVRMNLADGQVVKVLARDPVHDIGPDIDPDNFSARGWLRANLGPKIERPNTLAAEVPPPSVGWGVPVTYSARDGLAIPAFLHLPTKILPSKMPAVILCHGGPATMVSEGGNPEARFLASRGLIVLEPNFRGSGGFGKEFLEAGFRQWGRAMQDDLADGAKWLVDTWFVDPDRIGIVGASYGGYAALAGATLEPGTYRCAVAVAGPSNLLTFLDFTSGSSGNAYMRLTVGDPHEEAERLKTVSPALHAHQVSIPIFIAHGDRDSRVPVTESEQMVAALRAHGKSVEYVSFPEEGHSFWCEKNNLELYRAVERFLGLHLGSDVADSCRRWHR